MNSRRPLELTRVAERRTWFAMAAYVLIALLAAWQYQGPVAREEPEDRTSALRAIATLGLLLGESQVKHPAGSLENEQFRVRLLGMLDGLELETWNFPCTNRPLKTPGLVNIVARIPGRKAVRPIVVATHYDSCQWGPGAGDAGQCVAAVLEMVRALRSKPLEHELWLLFTDGEERGKDEGGLRGASDIVLQPSLPWGAELPVVINLDARGDRGAVLLYETHRENLAAMRVAAKSIARPRVTTSLMVNVYELLPNKTDYTIFRRANWPGWNFAVIGGTETYHTPDDNLQRLSPRSIGHFASHALALVRELDQLDDATLRDIEKSERAVFFDLLGMTVVVYPAWINWIFFALVGLMIAIACLRKSSHRAVRVGIVVRAVLTILVTVALSATIGWCISFAMRTTDLVSKPFVQGGEMICLAYVAIAMLGVVECGRRLPQDSRRSEVLLALVLIAWVLGGVASIFLPGGAYLLLLPAVWLSLFLIFDRPASGLRAYSGWAVFSICLGPALLLAPTYVLLAQAFGPLSGLSLAGVTSAMVIPAVLVWPELFDSASPGADPLPKS